MPSAWRAQREMLGKVAHLGGAGVTGGPTPSQVRCIVMGRWGPLLLEGSHEISPAAAAMLALHDDDLRFPSLRKISVASAQCLARHRHRPFLDGCRSVRSEASAAGLGNPCGTLALDGLRSLTPSAAKAIVQCSKNLPDYLKMDIRLRLNGIRNLSPEAAALSKFQPRCRLHLNGLRKPSPEAARDEPGMTFTVRWAEGGRFMAMDTLRSRTCSQNRGAAVVARRTPHRQNDIPIKRTSRRRACASSGFVLAPAKRAKASRVGWFRSSGLAEDVGLSPKSGVPVCCYGSA